MFKYNMGGSVPRETNIAGQRHSLAYINPFEEDLLNTQYRGGEGQPVPPFAGPGGVPTYIPDDGNRGKKKDPDANDPRGRDQRNTPRKEIKTLSPGGGPKSTPNRVSSSGTVATSKVDDTFGSGNIFSNPGTGSTTNFGNSGNTIDRSGYKDDNRPASSSAPQTSLRPVIRDTAPAVATSNVSGGPTKTELDAAKIARQEQGRSALELFANKITPNDFMEYNLFGELVYQAGHPTVEAGKAKVGDAVRADETNSFGFTVGMGNTNTNDANPGMYRGGFGSGVKTDLDMTFAAGFGTPEEQKMELLRAGYTEEMADAYLAQTAATRANMGTGMGGGGGGGGDTNDIVQDLVTGIADPCPEGYKMDPVTNACVIDTDIGIGAPVFTPQDPNAVAGGGGTGYTQPIGNFIPTPLQPTKMNPMQQQLNALTKSLQPQQNQQLAGGLAGIRR